MQHALHTSTVFKFLLAIETLLSICSEENATSWHRYRRSFENHCPFDPYGRTESSRNFRSFAWPIADPLDRVVPAVALADHQGVLVEGSAAERPVDSWERRRNSGAELAYPLMGRLEVVELDGKGFLLVQSCSVIVPMRDGLVSFRSDIPASG